MDASFYSDKYISLGTRQDEMKQRSMKKMHKHIQDHLECVLNSQLLHNPKNICFF